MLFITYFQHKSNVKRRQRSSINNSTIGCGNDTSVINVISDVSAGGRDLPMPAATASPATVALAPPPLQPRRGAAEFSAFYTTLVPYLFKNFKITSSRNTIYIYLYYCTLRKVKYYFFSQSCHNFHSAFSHCLQTVSRVIQL